jgi:3-oxocholest-4-en-26-oate---CoA ligase
VAEVLASHPSVLDAAVFALPHPRLGSTVTALLQLRPGTRIDAVLDHARGQLAGYKQPTIAIGVPAVPRTSAGKVDLTLTAARALAAAHCGADA